MIRYQWSSISEKYKGNLRRFQSIVCSVLRFFVLLLIIARSKMPRRSTLSNLRPSLANRVGWGLRSPPAVVLQNETAYHNTTIFLSSIHDFWQFSAYSQCFMLIFQCWRHFAWCLIVLKSLRDFNATIMFDHVVSFLQNFHLFN